MATIELAGKGILTKGHKQGEGHHEGGHAKQEGILGLHDELPGIYRKRQRQDSPESQGKGVLVSQESVHEAVGRCGNNGSYKRSIEGVGGKGDGAVEHLAEHGGNEVPCGGIVRAAATGHIVNRGVQHRPVARPNHVRNKVEVIGVVGLCREGGGTVERLDEVDQANDRPKQDVGQKHVEVFNERFPVKLTMPAPTRQQGCSHT